MLKEEKILAKLAMDCFTFKNPILNDAEAMGKIKGWKIPTWIPKLMMLASPIPQATYDQAVRAAEKGQRAMVGYQRIPMGMIVRVRDWATKHKISIKIIDCSYGTARVTDPMILAKDYQEIDTLREYQNQVCRKMVAVRRAQAISMTGSGKTIIMSGIIKHFDMPTIILCHRTLLVAQWKKAIKNFIGKEAYTLVGGKVTKGDSDILIASFKSIGNFTKEDEKKTLSKKHYDSITKTKVASLPSPEEGILKEKKLDLLNRNGFNIKALDKLVVIVDEAHVAPAFGYYNIACGLMPSIIYGCTATPFRKDGRSMLSDALFTDRAYETDRDRVLPYLTPMKYLTINVTDYFDSNIKEILNSNEAIMDHEFIKMLVGDPFRFQKVVRVIESFQKAGKTSAVICGNNMWLIDALEYALEQQCIKYGKIIGSTKLSNREDIVAKINAKEIDVILATSTIDEGVDIPSLDALILPVPFTSKIVSIQRAGRVARKFDGKKFCYIADMCDREIDKTLYAYYQRKRHIVSTFDVKETINIDDPTALAVKTITDDE